MTKKSDNEAWRLKAEQGDPDAQYEWGKLQTWGKRIAKNNPDAEKWFHAALAQFRAAAEKGNAHAQCQLFEPTQAAPVQLGLVAA